MQRLYNGQPSYIRCPRIIKSDYPLYVIDRAGESLFVNSDVSPKLLNTHKIPRLADIVFKPIWNS